MASANFWEIPSRALQTWQMYDELELSSLIFCSSQKPNSRSRSLILGAAASSLMQTTAPALTPLKGHLFGRAQSSSKKTNSLAGFFTARQN
jgi:hypothetical protein